MDKKFAFLSKIRTFLSDPKLLNSSVYSSSPSTNLNTCHFCEYYHLPDAILTFRPVLIDDDFRVSILHYVQPVHLRGIAQELILNDLHPSLQYLFGTHTHTYTHTKEDEQLV